MKLAVIKLGARISYNANDTSGGNGEARSIIKMLALAGADVHAYTKIIKRDLDPPMNNIHLHQIEEEYTEINDHDYDALVVINGSVNFFGGAEDRPQILNYNLINNFEGKVFYTHCDPALTFNQLWPSMHKKEWADKYDEKDVCITRDDIVIISQPYNLDLMWEAYDKKNRVSPAKIFQYPFEKFPLLEKRPEYNDNPLVDLSYGGTMRGGKREDNIIKFYFGLDEKISVELFGKIQEKNFKPNKIEGLRQPEYSKAVKYSEMIQKMNESIAHVVIGDKSYTDVAMINQRTYESILAGCVTFVDSSLDKNKIIYGDAPIGEFLYVDNQKQLEERLLALTSSPATRKDIIKEQWEAINFDEHKYSQGLIDLIKTNL